MINDIETANFTGYIRRTDTIRDREHHVELDEYEVKLVIKDDVIPRQLMAQIWSLCAGFANTADWEYYPQHGIVEMKDFLSLLTAERYVRFLDRHLDGVALVHGFRSSPIPWGAEDIEHWYRWMIMNLWQEGRHEETPLADGDAEAAATLL